MNRPESPDRPAAPPASGPILVSACLVGRFCRYDGRSQANPRLTDWLQGRPWAAVCPEQLAGLPTPRPAARIVGGDGLDVLNGRARVIDRDDRDVTEAFVRGAEIVLDLARRLRSGLCILKSRSPSCGLTPVPDPDGRPRGVCAALLLRNGIPVREASADDFTPPPEDPGRNFL